MMPYGKATHRNLSKSLHPFLIEKFTTNTLSVYNTSTLGFNIIKFQEYLRELLKLLAPKFYKYLFNLAGDALQLMFVHRWILLFFKREFPDFDALHIWEACWSRYRTSYFHLFVCVAIVSIYGPDVIEQGLPHDEILLYFASLAMHMEAKVVLKKVGYSIPAW